MHRYRFSIVTLARWETTTVLEWVAYHRSIGFEHVYLYCNDDDPAEMFDQVCPYLGGPSPFVTFLHYPFQGLQWDIYMHWFRHYGAQTEWVAFLDLDEFLTLPETDEVGRFFQRFPPDCDAVHFHWIYYGTSGFVERPPGSVLRQYTWREAKVSHETKTMVRPGRIVPDRLRPTQIPFWHVWDRSHGEDLRCYTELGEPVPNHFDRERLAADRGEEIRRTAFVAHFARKSTADFRRRVERGTGGQFSGQRMWADALADGSAERWIATTNAEQDLYLKRYWERLLGSPQRTSLVPRPPGANLAVGRSAMQSSTCSWSRHPDPVLDAAGAVSGVITGRASFHTDHEDGPWWQVDLGALCSVNEIRVFNRVDDPGVAARANRLAALASEDGSEWREVFRRTDEVPFGGADGNPLIWWPASAVRLRHLRLTVLARTWLSLDEVEVYGLAEAPARGGDVPPIAGS
jgi:hypothetical protein